MTPKIFLSFRALPPVAHQLVLLRYSRLLYLFRNQDGTCDCLHQLDPAGTTPVANTTPPDHPSNTVRCENQRRSKLSSSYNSTHLHPPLQLWHIQSDNVGHPTVKRAPCVAEPSSWDVVTCGGDEDNLWVSGYGLSIYLR